MPSARPPAYDGGFLIFGLSEMTNTRTFGLLAAMAAIVAFLADLLVAPAMLTLVERWRHRRRRRAAVEVEEEGLEQGSAA